MADCMEFRRGLAHLCLMLPFLSSVIPMVTNSNSESPSLQHAMEMYSFAKAEISLSVLV